MRFDHGLHLAYCTNIHRGETWTQTLATLQRYTLAVRDQVSPRAPYAIGLRLGDQASRELSEPASLAAFRRWLEEQNCYVFTINGFPYGRFHGTRVKEQVYAPDWTTRERVEYTNRLFDLLAALLPDGIDGSVSTVPISYKEFIRTEDQVRTARANVWQCVDHIARLSERTGRQFHLGLEPEPLCYLETTSETVRFFEDLRSDRPGDAAHLDAHLGVNYDCCHLAVEFEEPAAAMTRLRDNGIKISKIHLSSALKVVPTPETRAALEAFVEDVYFHQVIARQPDGSIKRYRDLDVALAQEATHEGGATAEWRIHFHIPLHSRPTPLFDNTADHMLGILDLWRQDPGICSHMEMETYTWEVMPSEMKNRNVVDQLVSEYHWTMAALEKRGVTAVN